MNNQVVRVALLAIVSFLVVLGAIVWWHIADERTKARAEAARIEADRSPPLGYGEPAGSFLSDRLLTTEEIEERVTHPQIPTLAPGATVWACFARVTWHRNDCRVTLHWWYEEIPPGNPDGPRLRLDFDKSEHELNHQDYIGKLPDKCRPMVIPELLKPGRQYAMGSKNTAECPGSAKYGPIYVTPPEMKFTAAPRP